MADEKRATTLEEVWNNFPPSGALAPDSIFRIERPHVSSRRSIRDLKRAKDFTKWFLIGHRGCGKSTHLRYLLAQDEVEEKFLPISYIISDVADMNDLSYEELLFSVASKLVEAAQTQDAITPKLEKRLENWGSTVVKEVTRAENASAEVKGGLEAFFMGFLLKLQTQHSTRDQFRKIIEPQVSELINIIDDVTAALEQKTGKTVLVAIDDLERSTVAAAKKLFGDYLVSLQKPKCHIIYTVPVALMHENVWTNLDPSACWYIPNIKLHKENRFAVKDKDGYKLMQTFIEKRMDLGLITEDALKELITYGGGVFRQTCSLMQIAVDYAEDRDKDKIGVEEVRSAAAEIANGLLPQLTTKDLDILKQIAEGKGQQEAFEHSKLLHNLSVLRYPNDHHWHDVNPVLREIIDAHEPKPDKDA